MSRINPALRVQKGRKQIKCLSDGREIDSSWLRGSLGKKPIRKVEELARTPVV